MAHTPVVYGKYQLLERLARGGMAEVFKAKSHGVEGFEKVLVIKRILPDLSENPSFVEMFINEAKIAVTLSHANIVQVFDLGRADDTYFIAMEYVAGLDFATLLRRAKRFDMPLTAELAVFVISEVAKGLDYAHRRRDAELRPLNIVHCDVSPQNILISHEGEVKLTDFGIAKARTTMDTSTSVLKGKYAYMAPEQARGEAVDARTDLYALGIVLYEAISGKSPFSSGSAYETLSRVKEGDYISLAKQMPGLPVEISGIVDKAMAPNPDDRFADAGEFYEALIQYLYSTGRRIGAQDLSRFVEAMQAAKKGRVGEDTDIRRAFEVETRAGRHTPSEMPSRTGEPSSSTGGSRRNPAEQAVRRDVTFLATPALEASRAILEKRGPRIEDKDGMLVATYGLNRPDGRDAEAAARDALAIQKLGQPVAVRSSKVVLVAGKVRSEKGDDVPLTLGLVAQASPGEVLVSAESEVAMRRYFELIARGGGVFELKSEKGDRPLSTFVGRKEELKLIGETLLTANAGLQRSISIEGEAGTGKTRLVQEMERRLRETEGKATVFRSQMPGRGPYSGVRAALKQLLGIAELTAEEDVREKITRLRELNLSPDEIQAIESIFGLGDNPSDHHLIRAIGRIASKLAEDQLIVFVFDDCHRLDDESHQLLSKLLGAQAPVRVLIFALHRPGTLNFAWVENHLHIELGALTPEALSELVAARLGVDVEDVPKSVVREVSNKSAGNPLYAEEYVYALRDSGAIVVSESGVTFDDSAVVEVPRTLRGIVSARLERLSEEERHYLRLAATIGGRFHDAMIATAAGAELEVVRKKLGDLAEQGILRRPVFNEFMFAHEVVGQVIWDSIPVELRKDLHGVVATAFERVYPKHLDELAERLAEHHREHGNRGRAIDYLVRAANRQESEHALTSAANTLQLVVDLILGSPRPDRERALRLYQRIADFLMRTNEVERAIKKVKVALDLAEGIGREDYVARFSLLHAQVLTQQGKLSEAAPWYDRARRLAKRMGNSDLVSLVMRAEANANAKNGRYGEAVVLLQESLNMAKEGNDVLAQIQVGMPLAYAYAGNGDTKSGMGVLDDIGPLVASIRDAFIECEFEKAKGLVYYFASDGEAALECFEKALNIAKEYGFTHEACVNAHNLGETLMLTGDFKRAFAQLSYSYGIAKEIGHGKMMYSNLRVLGFIDAVKLGSSEGRAHIAASLEFAKANGFVWDETQSRYMLAFVDYRLGQHEQATRAFSELARFARECGQQHYAQVSERAVAAIQAGQEPPLPTLE